MATTARLDIRTITPVVGAVIEGVDLAEPLDPEIVQQIRETVLQQGVVFFPEQELTQPQAVAFLKQFGRPATDPYRIRDGAVSSEPAE